MRVRLGIDAIEEARAARIAFRHRDPASVARFRLRMKQAVRQLGEYPDSGPPHMGDARKLRLDPFPYSLIYRIEARHVLIVAVAHDAQRPGYWMGRRG